MSKHLSLFPLLLFVLLFMVGGIYFDDFYAVSSVFWIFVVTLLAFVLFKGSFREKLDTFVKGMGDYNILSMCFIFMLSGAFTALTKASGAVAYFSYWVLQIFPSSFLLLGVFLMACLLSFAMGTSVGTIVALAPMLYQMGGENVQVLAMLGGVLLGGAMFGDNLSFISDTTIAATQTMQVSMKAKFRANASLAFLAAFLCCGLLCCIDMPPVQPSMLTEKHSFVLLLPYLLVIVLALFGWNVIKVLMTAVAVAWIILMYQQHSFVKNAQLLYEGMGQMFEIIALSLFIGGLIQMIIKAGGIQWMIYQLKKIGKNKPTVVPWVMVLMIVLVNFSVANNTIALLIAGPMALQLTHYFALNKPKITSLLDIFSCVTQSILPFGAQVLILLSLFEKKIDYVALMSYNYYIYILLGVALLALLIGRYQVVKKDVS